jgi:serine/threonine protein kinase
VAGEEGPALPAGQRALLDGRYRKERLLGQGGMGEVWLARDEALDDRPVAVKLMRPGALAGAQGRERFEREMRLTARMRHANITTVYTTGTDEGMPFMVMEYLQGQDLGKKAPPRDATEVARIGRDICSALAYAHGLKPAVVHRDIKPENIFLCDTGLVKVTDFGIAMAVTETRLTQSGYLMGSLDYLAPEQLDGDPPTVSSDIWAVGTVLYKLLADVLPRSFVVRGRPVPPLTTIAGVPGWLSDAIMAMVAVDPGERPAAAECVRLLSLSPLVPARRPGPVPASRDAGEGLADDGREPVAAASGPHSLLALWLMPQAVGSRGRQAAWVTAAATCAVASFMVVVALSGPGAPAGTAGAGYLLGFAGLFMALPYALYRAFRQK